MRRLPRRNPARMRLTAHRRALAFGLVAILAVGLFALLSVRPLGSGRSEVRQVHADDTALRQVLDFRATMGDFQIYVEPHLAQLSTTASVFDPSEVGRGATLVQTALAQAQAVAKLLRTYGLASDAKAISDGAAGFTKAIAALSPLSAGAPAPVFTTAIAQERASYVKLRAITATTATQLRRASDLDAAQSIAQLDSGRKVILSVDAIAAFLVACTAIEVARRARRRERIDRTGAVRQRFESALHQGLEMAKTESQAYSVMTKALIETVPHLQVELLVADSSRAHFHQSLTTASGPEQRSGCGVVSPLDCPATTRGQTLVFPTSRALDACPHLEGRASGDCSAACVAISITGKTVGVVHATGPDCIPPTPVEVDYLEVTARRASERIAMLRAFEKSEAQARTDPLTGLFNRRSLENRVNDLYREESQYAVAYGDLDHFKELNDTHGHEAGDRALRLFARVMRDSIRPTDITARWGGEEFLIVLPDCNVETALRILERLREGLALTLAAGRVPAFTVSFGLASSVDAGTFEEVVAVADRALLMAKTSGRNRTVLSADVPADVSASAALSKS